MAWSLAELGARLGAEMVGADAPVEGILPLDEAGPNTLTVCVDRRRLAALQSTSAAGVLLPRRLKELAEQAPCAVLLVDDVKLALAAALELFHPRRPLEPGIDAKALVEPGAQVAESARLEPGAQVGRDATIGAQTSIGRGSLVLPGAEIGCDCTIGPNVVIYGCCRLGDRVRIGAGSVLGSAGFGYAQDGAGLHSVPQVGRVTIADDVDLGALCTVDRGTLGATSIGAGSKIDNLVQVGHNVTIGRNVCIAAQCGLSGSVTIGDGVRMGGQVGVADRLTIGAGAEIGAKSGVGTHVPPGARVAGYPAVAIRSWLRRLHLWKKLERLVEGDSDGAGDR